MGSEGSLNEPCWPQTLCLFNQARDLAMCQRPFRPGLRSGSASCQATDPALDVWAGVKRWAVGLLWISALKRGQGSDSPAQPQLLFTSVLPLSALCFVVLNYGKIAVSWGNPKARVVLCWFLPSTEFSLMHT